MSPEEAIEKLDQLQKQLNQTMHAISLECDGIEQHWDGLKRVGGARADHAAIMLGRLRPALDKLSRQSKAIELQITGWVADPFQSKAVANAS